MCRGRPAWRKRRHRRRRPLPPLSPPAAGQPAAPTSQQAPDPVGSVATLQGTASVTRNNATSALALRDSVYKNDVLQTNVDGTLGITFDDETTFTLKPNTRLAVDEFVYQEGGTDNAAVFNVAARHRGFRRRRGRSHRQHEDRHADIDPGHSRHHRSGRSARGRRRRRPVSIKLYPDADGRVGRIEVFGRDGAQLGILSRGATGFAVRPGARRASLHRRTIADFGAGSRARPLRSCARRLRRGPSAVRSISSAAPCSNSSAISCGPINPISSDPVSCRDASSGRDCNNSGLSCGPCPADSHCRRPARGRRSNSRAQGPLCNSSPARRRHSNNNPVHGRLCNNSRAPHRPAVDQMRRHCSNSPARGRRCSGRHSRVRNARPPDRASRQRKTRPLARR